jgi:hypothetical protein
MWHAKCYVQNLLDSIRAHTREYVFAKIEPLLHPGEKTLPTAFPTISGVTKPEDLTAPPTTRTPPGHQVGAQTRDQPPQFVKAVGRFKKDIEALIPTGYVDDHDSNVLLPNVRSSF